MEREVVQPAEDATNDISTLTRLEEQSRQLFLNFLIAIDRGRCDSYALMSLVLLAQKKDSGQTVSLCPLQ
jgi:hypothetical protein